MSSDSPRIVFFNINGSGMGHLSRCLAYALRLRGRARPIFFSLASAIEIIRDLGFEADYFVSAFWSRSHINAWNRELAVRFGLMLEQVKPDVVVFDGTWPFHGFMDACATYGHCRKVWSNRGLHKKDFAPVPVKESSFDLVLRPGELGTPHGVLKADPPGRIVETPPVTLLRTEDLLDRAAARADLGLQPDRRYALFSLGPGNLKDVGDIAASLIVLVQSYGFDVAWARAPITTRDVDLPDDVIPLSRFPLSRYLRAFDVFVGAAGYNSCYEILQAGIPALLVPNEMVADDQARRAAMIAQHAPVVVSPCRTDQERRQAAESLMGLGADSRTGGIDGLGGAEVAADEILSLAGGG